MRKINKTPVLAALLLCFALTGCAKSDDPISAPPANDPTPTREDEPSGDLRVTFEGDGMEYLDGEGVYTVNYELWLKEIRLPGAEDAEESVKALIQNHFGGIETWMACEKYGDLSEQNGYPIWNIQYFYGENEDAVYCQDALVLLPGYSVLLHTTRDADLDDETQRGYEIFVIWLFDTIRVSAD